MTRIVLVHGSVVGGRATWREQRRSVSPETAELVVLERPGFEPQPRAFRRRSDTRSSADADRLRGARRRGSRSAFAPGDHLVGHSYGGVIALLAAAAVGEPPRRR